MIIKKSTYKKVMVERHEKVTEDVYGCDECSNKIDDQDALSMSVFTRSDGNDPYMLCSWECFFNFIAKVECDDCIYLPRISCRQNDKNSIKDFLKVIKPLLK